MSGNDTNAGPSACVHGWVSGRVQGVAFRASFAKRAQELDLDGWVRNCADGRVEFVVRGGEATVRSMISWARVGPRLARVDDLTTAPADDAPIGRGFEIRY